MTPPARPPPQGVLDTLTLTLPHEAVAASRARKVVRETLVAWGVDQFTADAQLAVSELVTNAVLHGLPPVELSLHRLTDCLQIEVSDGRPFMTQHKVRALSRPDDESGRGRGIVEQVSDHSGVNQSGGEGKSAYAAWNLDPQQQ